MVEYKRKGTIWAMQWHGTGTQLEQLQKRYPRFDFIVNPRNSNLNVLSIIVKPDNYIVERSVGDSWTLVAMQKKAFEQNWEEV